MYINRATLYGNLTRDPELKALPSGSKVVNFGIATNRQWKNADGVKQDASTFHNIVAFGKQAELIAQYLHKGDGIFVEGRIDNRSWDDKDGQKKYRSEVVIENFQFGPKSGGNGGMRSESSAPSSSSSAPAKSKMAEMDTIEYPTEEINPEDIPF